jgi:hypothetical protein
MATRRLLALALLAAAAIAALVWWAGRSDAPPRPAAPRAAPISGAEPVAPLAWEPRRSQPFERPTSQADTAAPVPAPSPFGAFELVRDKPAVEGPVVESWYEDGGPEFAGRQVLDAAGRWQLDGPWQAWHENGQPHERGAYANGAEDGPWEWWYDNGRPMAAGTWIEGRRVGRWSFWQERGALGATGHYVDGQGDGPWTLYHENGRPWISGALAAGVPDGLWQVWNEDGTLDLELTGTWSGGERVHDDP